MKKASLLLMFLAVQTVLLAQEIYYPEGTKWTEIRLDTTKYDTWYSKVGDEWVPNYETVEYQVTGERMTRDEGKGTGYDIDYACVYTNGPTWTDSLTLLVTEESNDYIYATVPATEFVVPGLAYEMAWEEWKVGEALYYIDIHRSNETILAPLPEYGVIREINEGDFGGVRPLKYADLDGGLRVLHGIGVTEWKDGECIFGAVEPYKNGTPWDREVEVRHFRSMLVRFERNGELLYDVWPEKPSLPDGVKTISQKPAATVVYDLNGRPQSAAPAKGIYIQNGHKHLAK